MEEANLRKVEIDRPILFYADASVLNISGGGYRVYEFLKTKILADIVVLNEKDYLHIGRLVSQFLIFNLLFDPQFI